MSTVGRPSSPTLDGIADYEFVRALGEGSHGSFWQARCPARLGIDVDHVSVKTIAHNATDDDFARLVDELQHYAAVQSTELVPLYDVGQQGAILYYASEYFADGSLDKPARPFTSRASVLSAMADAALAAHALHEAGIAHRAIKPGNVMLDGDRGKLGDIGLSHVLNPGQTVTGLDNVGSLGYLAPELVQGGQTASRATDIWALGATLHKTLTGRSVYPEIPDASLLESLRHLLTAEPTLNDSLQADERELIGRAIAADPADRPSTALEFAERAAAISAAAARSEGA